MRPLVVAVAVLLAAGCTHATSAGTQPAATGTVAAANAASASTAGTLTDTPGHLLLPARAAASAEADTYVAIVAGQLHVFDAATNAQVRQLAPGATGITEVAVSDDRRWVFYLRNDAPCGGRVWKIMLDGRGAPQPETTWLSGLSAFGISGVHSEWLSYVYTPCGAGAQTLFWSIGGDQLNPPSINGPSRPPELTSIAVSPDGHSASGVLRTGTQGNVYTYLRAQATSGGPAVVPSPPPAKTLVDGTVPQVCKKDGAPCVGATYAPNGDLLTVTSDGTKFTVSRQHGTSTTTLFSVDGVGQDATLDTDPTGTKVLLSDGTGHAWSWSGAGAAKALPGSITDASW